MRFWLFVSFVFFLTLSANCQVLLTGKTVDASTGAPVPFVSVSLLNARSGTTSDITGSFRLNANVQDTLVVSSIGYKSQRIAVRDAHKAMFIKLEPAVNELPEVAIYPGENPAHRIIRNATANRSRNNPENLQSYRYRAYHKFYATLDGAVLSDSINTKRNRVLDSAHFFLNESVTEKQFRAPAFSKETVLGNKMAGIDDPFFVVLATDFQPFTFYNDHITLLNRNYRNPISPGSLPVTSLP